MINTRCFLRRGAESNALTSLQTINALFAVVAAVEVMGSAARSKRLRFGNYWLQQCSDVIMAY